MHDLIIIGGGPAGLTAAAYALHKRINTLLISERLGGKTNYRFRVKGYEGHELITGQEIVDKFQRQLEYLDFAHRVDRVTHIFPTSPNFVVQTQSGEQFETRAVIIATGAFPRMLKVPGEERLISRGVSYSALSHAQLFLDKETALVGSTPRAMRAAAELAWVCKKVHMILPERGEIDSPLGKKVRDSSNVLLYENARVMEIRGDDYVSGIVVQTPGGAKEIPIDGLFIEIGLDRSSNFATDLGLEVNDITKSLNAGRIVVDTKNATSRAGVFAAGDVSDVFGEQVLIAIAEGAKAGLGAYEYLLNQ
jgi:NADH-dependent peroxiredoxin subunit F